jgi:hypothetical protein
MAGHLSSLSASFRLNAPHVDEDADVNPQAADSTTQAATNQRSEQQTFDPSFRLNAPQQVDDVSLDTPMTEPTPIANRRAEDLGGAASASGIQAGLRGPSMRAEENSQIIENRPPDAQNEVVGATSTDDQHGQIGPTSSDFDQEFHDFDLAVQGAQKRRPWCTRKIVVIAGVVLALVIVAIVLIVVYVPGNSSSSPPVMTTLEMIKSRGSLLCGVGGLSGFSALNTTTGQREGFEVDLVCMPRENPCKNFALKFSPCKFWFEHQCRAVGAAVFGTDGHVQYSVVSSDDQFSVLESGAVDLLAAGTPYTIQSDVYEVRRVG